MRGSSEIGVLYDLPQVLGQEVRGMLDLSANLSSKVLENTDSNYNFQDYVSILQKYEVLTPEQEISLFEQYENGDPDAFQTILFSNLRLGMQFAKKEIKKGHNTSLTLFDYFQETIFGLYKAIEDFDKSLGYKFSTYANSKLRKSIQDAVKMTAYLIRLPVSLIKNKSKIEREQEILRKKLKREPSLEEIAVKLSLPTKKVFEVVNSSRVSYSLDDPISENSSLGDIIPGTVDSAFEILKKSEVIKDALKILNEREYFVITHAFGLGVDKLSLREIGRRMNRSDGIARKLYKRGLKNLRESKFASQLEDLY